MKDTRTHQPGAVASHSASSVSSFQSPLPAGSGFGNTSERNHAARQTDTHTQKKGKKKSISSAAPLVCASAVLLVFCGAAILCCVASFSIYTSI